MILRTVRNSGIATFLSLSLVLPAAAQSTQSISSAPDQGRARTSEQRVRSIESNQLAPADPVTAADDAAIQAQISSVYESFHNSYRLGPGDVIGIYIDKHPEDSVERVTVSPVGRVYFPLVGNVTVVGKTLPQLQEYFSNTVAEFIKEPRVTLSLLEASSAKIGVLGDVRQPGVLVLTRPLRVLDAITMAGGITETGSQNLSILRQFEDGRVQILSVDLKKILKGKASPEDNLYLRAGDTIIVHGNLFKTVQKIGSLVGLTTLVTFMTHGGH
jgi:polysaccharide biosynthesis/export protein